MKNEKLHTDYKLSKLDIKVLKNSDDICFAYSFNHNSGNLGEIRGIMRGNNLKNSTGFEQTKNIPVNTRFTIYLDSAESKYQTGQTQEKCFEFVKSCFVMAGLAYNGILQTIIGFLKEGDIITLEWEMSSDGYVRGAKSTVINDDGYVVARDERMWFYQLDLSITREDKSYKFIVDALAMPQNSASMVRII